MVRYVTQAIDTSLLRTSGTRLGFININEQAAGNAELEQRIITQEASYGSQLGRLMDAVAVLVRHTDPEALSPSEGAALSSLLEMRGRIDTVKQQDKLVGR